MFHLRCAVAAAVGALAVVVLANSTAAAARAQGTRTLSFSGYNWTVKSSAGLGRLGPGPNYFSDAASSVWVDAQGRLHLKISKSKGRWYCAEIVSQQSFGLGTYRFYLDSPVDALDPNVVLGLFTWNDDPAYNHREIDIEFSRWGDPNNSNSQYVVQPYTAPANLWRFNLPAGVPQSTHSFAWTSASVFHQSLRGLKAASQTASDVLAQKTFTSGIPAAGGENARINLWLRSGLAPTNGQPLEIIVNRFTFTP